MDHQAYITIEKAIVFIRENFYRQPSLDEIARHVHLSPFHFQRMFHEWAGITPKKFLQHVSLNYAKYLLREKQQTLFDTAAETGLSGTGRLHDMFIQLEGMTPAEYKSGGNGLHIDYGIYPTMFGKVIIASTPKGICYIHFAAEMEDALAGLQKKYPGAMLAHNIRPNHEDAIACMSGITPKETIRLHVKGSPFQLKVWEALLQIPEGHLTSYGDLSRKINQPDASRAIGTAIGQNPVAFLIPCHRVIRSDGGLGGYMWGINRKSALIAWEQVKA
jgi:AraC family transcriptional regulator of adaptative response/methylated-DNA-[protein]-cysteine methyltransferase